MTVHLDSNPSSEAGLRLAFQREETSWTIHGADVGNHQGHALRLAGQWVMPLVWKVLKLLETIIPPAPPNVFGKGPVGDLGTSEIEICDHNI